MIRKGTKIQWKWGQGTAQGVVKETFTNKVSRTLSGTEVTREGTSGDKALLIEQEDGTEVLKLESEVKRRD
ncbi:DUF2945 domain-containing protein [Altibacter sp.]|uniref:DUF2945 domain-containing protein n=1 Tax=Altibacter sp. TaxID=2024823 RepID=UPI000C96A82D|nr:DUF2945 domain-containing protein [Altibacter sp.]MAP54672.1 hypothetical protein [Altibacter sp.]